MAKIFSILGDSNVKRHLNPINCRDRPIMSSAQQIPCQKLEIFAECLRSVREESNVCIISCLTNFVCSSSDESSTVCLRLAPVFTEVFEKLRLACIENVNRAYLVCPPTYRKYPLWYREGLPEVLTRFSAELMRDRPPNLLSMPSFPTPSFEDDAVHLTAYSGLEFVLHLFDSANTILDQLPLEPGIKVVHNRESTRLLEDRMIALEQDHQRLNAVVDHKIAHDAELADVQINERNEDSFIIFGLPAIPSTIVGKPWQDRAKKDLQDVVRVVIGRECSVIVITNITSRVHPDPEVRYKVRLTSAEESELIRTTFSKFFTGNGDTRPPSLKGISIRNLLTQETRVRLSLLHLYAKRYLDSNPGAKTKVIGFESRPILKLTPPPDASDRRVQVMTFMDAVQRLPSNFSKEELKQILDQVRYTPKFYGKLRSLFVVLSDDLLPRRGGRPPSDQGASSSDPADQTRKRVASDAGRKGKNKNQKK